MSPADDSLDRWVATTRPGLVRQAERILRDRAEAENVVQATLEAVWRARLAGEVEDLHQYARRAVHLNALRARVRRREHVPLDALADDEETVGRVGAGAGPSGDLSAWELERAILGLPPAQQAVLRLRFYAGLTFQEIGHALAISMNTAASRCRYALRALREALDPERSGRTGGGEEP